MAEILGKDLDNWDDSLAAREPYSLSESSTTGAQFITGADLLRSAKISSEWRDPVAIYAQAYNPMSKAFQVSESALTATVDTVRNLPSNVANLGAQTFIELSEGERMLPDVSSALTAKSGEETLAKLRKALSQSQQSIDEAVFLLKDRDYPVSKFARRVIADTTANVENRKIVRELYNQAHGIDSSKWYNEAGSIIGAMLPAMVAGNVAFSGARAFGAGRLAAVNTAKNIVKGYIGAEMAGQYAEETAAEYLARTGDKNFENFTAKDASGMMASAYGAIGAQIEFMGGVEPVFAGALTKVGLRSSALKAGAKIGVGEATEELLQGLTETLMRKIDGTSDKTWKEGFEESLKGATWGLFIGGTLGTTAFYTNRRNLVKGIKAAIPSIEEAQAELIADAMIETTGEISSQEPSLRNNLRQKVALIFKDADIENKEDRIDAITDLEYGLVAMDAAERGIDLAEHELFSGEVNELGWFRTGIPEERRVEIQDINENIRDLKTQLKELNKAEQKDWAKIEETENKLAQANQYVLEKLSDLARDDAAAVRRMLRGVEEKYVNKEKKKAGIEVPADTIEHAKSDKSLDFTDVTETNGEGYKQKTIDGINVEEVEVLGSLQDVATKAKYGIESKAGNWSLFTIDYRLGVITMQPDLDYFPFNFSLLEYENSGKDFAHWAADKIDEFRNAQKGKDEFEFANAYAKEHSFKKATENNPIYEEGKDVLFQEQFDIANENARLDDIYPEYTGETIEVDGKERTVYNSTGERIAKSAEALRNFYKWFGDSKVVDKKGRPLVVHHGTKTEFEEFYRSSDIGFHFGSKGAARIKAGRGKQAVVYNVYLKIQNPLKFDRDLGNWDAAKDSYLATELLNMGIITQEQFNGLRYNFGSYGSSNAILLRNALKEKGFDGIEYPNYYEDTGKISYIAFEPTQIKSTDNRGTYSSDTGNIYWQDEEPERNLVVTHGITPDKLEKVLKLGGFPVPSIAISKITEPLTNFGTIKLVGTKNIINPELRSSNLVYDRDIWSKRFPRPEYKNAKITDVRKFREKFEKYFTRADNSSVLYGSITDPLVNSRYPAQAIEAFQNSDGAKLYYIENFLGDKIDVPKYDRAKRILDNLTLFVKADEQFIKEIAEIDVNIDNIDKLRKEVEKPIRDLINRYDFEKKYNQYANKIKQEAENHYFSEKFKGSDITYMIRSAKEYLRMMKDDNIRYGVDNMNLDSVINKYNLYDNKEYMDWSEKQITDLLGEPRVMVGNKLMPWTVENIAASMIKGKTIGTESDSISIGKIIASGAERFTNLESIREAGKRLQPQKQSEEQTDQLGHDMYTFAEDIIAVAELSDNFSNIDMVLLSLQEGVSKNSITEDGLEKLLNKNLDIFAKYPRNMLKRGVELIKQTKEIVRFYFEAKPQRVVSLNEFAGAVVPTDARYDDISAKLRERGLYVARTNNLEEGIRYIESQTPVLFQNRVSGAAPSTYRGAYIPQYRFILRANRMDASTLSHELAHDWFETNFARYRSGKATKDFMRAWGALEKALGVPENATSTPRQASEAFARAYEAWIVQNEDWAKLVNVEDKDRDAVEKLMKDYQNDLRDIYNDISNPYFKQTWGKLGELKPELKAWFDRVVNITDLDVMVERGEMTAEEAGAERLNRAIDTVVENTEDADTVQVLKEARTLNDTQRYEAEGGNKNSLQMRLSALAREIDENNMLVKENYDTRRDMMAVAEAADNFVKTRLDDALAIINGQMAEVEGLYKEDLYTALERLAVENGDLGLIDELKNSEIANRLGKELGQRVAGFRNFKQSTDLDVVSALKSLDNSYNKALENKKAQKQFNEALAMLDKSLKVQDSIADKQLDATLKELECK